jgi:hypothetical protein
MTEIGSNINKYTLAASPSEGGFTFAHDESGIKDTKYTLEATYAHGESGVSLSTAAVGEEGDNIKPISSDTDTSPIIDDYEKLLQLIKRYLGTVKINVGTGIGINSPNY